jgi:hypothetical protein
MDEIVKIVAESEKIFFNYFLTILFGDKFFKN